MSASLSQSRVLLVGADRATRRLLTAALKRSGFVISRTDSGNVALRAVWRNETDLLLLDLEHRDVDGLQVIRRIRYARSYVPIIALSNRDDEGAKVAAFELGADAYITKPVMAGELLARIRVLQRHFQPPAQPTVAKPSELRISPDRCCVTVHGTEVKLSQREYDLLRLLITHAGKVLTHGYILRTVWNGGNHHVQYLRIYISRIRQKIEPVPAQPRFLVTEQGVGYRLCLPDW
jgi:two-component system, OmpR family, KDP operon response regulator KdpE